VSEQRANIGYPGVAAAYGDGGAVSDYVALLKPRVMSLVAEIFRPRFKEKLSYSRWIQMLEKIKLRYLSNLISAD